MTIAEFRKKVRATYPRVLISVRTVSFVDLARVSAKCLTVAGEYDSEELRQINAWAREAKIVPYGGVRISDRSLRE